MQEDRGDNPEGRLLDRATEHPLLTVVDNPVNLFCDDFASALDDEPSVLSAGNDAIARAPDGVEGEGYRVVKLIGQGAEAYVYKAIELQSNEKVAIKVYKRANAPPKEIEIANMLNHPSILKFRDSVELVRNHEKKFAAVMRLSTYGSLCHSDVPELTVTLAIQLLDQIGGALAHMHSKNIVHRDIKPQNILVFDSEFQLCDFSVSVVLQNPDQTLSGQFGTSVFMAPEIARNVHAPKPTDMWSLGITVFCLIYGKFPFALDNFASDPDKPAHIRVTDNVMPYPLVFPEWPVIPEELRNIISGLLDKDPTKRMTAEELANNPWITEEVTEWKGFERFLNRSSLFV